MSDNVTEQLLKQQNELKTELNNANDMCDKWFVCLKLSDKIELMQRYYQLRERSRFVVCDKEMIHVWDNTGVKNGNSGEVKS